MKKLIFTLIVFARFAFDVQAAVLEGDIQGWKSTYQEIPFKKNCDENALTLSRCASEQAAHSEKHLDLLTEKISKEVTEPEAKLLKKSHSLWTQFRDVSCNFDSASSDGNSAAYQYAACQHIYNKSRIQVLSKYHYCRTGGECPNGVSLYWFMEPKNK